MGRHTPVLGESSPLHYLLIALALGACSKPTFFNPRSGVPAPVVPVLSVQSVTPDIGSIAGGTAIVITGTDFLADASVTIGGEPCQGVKVVSETRITCTTAAHSAGGVAVVVTNPDGTYAILNGQYAFLANTVVAGENSIQITTGQSVQAQVTVGGGGQGIAQTAAGLSASSNLLYQP